MSDSEGPPGATQTHTAHATTGGKSLDARPKYKSWRKKYRKMRHSFDGVLEENKRLFKEEQKLEGIARRLREELDGLLEILLDLNQNPALPTWYRYDIRPDERHTQISQIPNVVPDNITPQEADGLLQQYQNAVQSGQIPHLDMFVIRDQIDTKLAAQGVDSLLHLANSTNYPMPKGRNFAEIPEELREAKPANYLTSDEEEAYLLRMDAKLGDPICADKIGQKEKEGANEILHWAEMTPREVERQIELQNPQSQHNWLKKHQWKGAADVDDNESLASHDTKPAAARGGKGKKRDLAQQVGDSAVRRAREGQSPGAASGFGDDDDGYSFVDDHPASSRKRKTKDEDGGYRPKGGKPGGGNKKRKRPTEEGSTSAKKPKVDIAND